MRENDRKLPNEVYKFLVHCTRSVPGGVECDYCHFTNTYEPFSLKWVHLGGNHYGFEKVVRCCNCGHKQGFRWDQEFKVADKPQQS